MARWAGWGRGPAGAGAAGPSRPFLFVAAVAAGGVAVVLGSQERWGGALTCGGATLYFLLRATGKLGPRSSR